MSRMERALNSLLDRPGTSAPDMMIDLASQTLMAADDVRIAERPTANPDTIHFERAPGEKSVVIVHAHPKHHRTLLTLLDAWREAKEAKAMGPCSRCNGTERLWAPAGSPEARAYFESYGIRVLRFKEPLVDIACPCSCHEEGV